MLRPSPIALSSVVAVLVLAAALAPSIEAQGVSEAQGKVVDREGNPVAGAVVTFRAGANTANEYSGATNAKGRYFVQGLYTPKEDESWFITIEKEGMLPVQVRVESRTVNRVLVGDIMEEPLSFEEKVPPIKIRPLGNATVDFTMAPAEAVQAEAKQPAAGLIDPATGAAAAEAQAEPPKKDPWDEGARLAGAGELEAAAEAFGKAVEEEPEAAERHEALAKVLYRLERKDAALAAAKRAVELAPEGVGPRMVVYSVQVSQEDWDGARATLDAARQVAPTDVRVLEQMAFVAERTDRPDDALAAYTAIIEIDPTNTDAWAALGGLHAQAGRSTESEAAYGKVAELAPDSAYKTFYNIGALIMNRDERTDADMRRAIDAFRRAIEIKPDYAEAQRQLGFALLNVADRAGAKQALQAYLELRPDAPDAGQMRAIVQSLSK